MTEPHVSLSKVLILKYGQIPEFTQSVRQALESFPAQILDILHVEIYVNEEKTRTFLGLRVRGQSLDAMVDTLDVVLEDFGLPAFYETRSFHVSVLWALGDQEQLLRSRIGQVQSLLRRESHLFEQGVRVEALECKCGNKIFKFNLTS